ncbi:hypothetical protein DER45DRAFT_62550 [Fusarium avenaceum]|nr:hypothetical protein DER45DRAFT_62550 [Fusarium avenaceum]
MCLVSLLSLSLPSKLSFSLTSPFTLTFILTTFPGSVHTVPLLPIPRLLSLGNEPPLSYTLPYLTYSSIIAFVSPIPHSSFIDHHSACA